MTRKIYFFLTVLLSLTISSGAYSINFQISDTESGKMLSSGQDTIGFFMSFASPGIRASDSIVNLGNGIFKWTRTFKLKNQSPPETTRLIMDFKTSYRSSFSMIPSVSYNGNQWKEVIEPRGYISEDGTPWSFASHRTSVPGATYSENNCWTISLFSRNESSDCGFSCSMIPGPGATTHRLIWPEEEMPIVFYSKWEPFYKDGYQNKFSWPEDGQFVVTAYLIVGKKTEGEVGYQKMLEVAWEKNFKSTQAWYSPEKIWTLGIEYCKKSLWNPNEKMFIVGLKYDGDKGYEQAGGYQLGWAGANGTVSVSLIYDYLINKDRSSMDMAIGCLDAWAARQLDNGLIDATYQVNWLVGQDICNQAQGAEAFFNAYLLLKEHNIDKPHYLKTALRVCDFMINAQTPGGLIGKSWDNDGVCLESEGSIGCFMVRPLMMAYEITGNEKYYEAAMKGYDYYYNEFIQQGFATAGAIDIYTIDKEGAVGLLQGAIKIYEHSGNPDFLNKAKQAAYYLSTWQYHYSVKFPESSPLFKMKYETFGGTSIATFHQALDPYAVQYFTDLVKLANYTENEIWLQRAIAIWNNATNGISDGTLAVLDHPAYPAGAQSEAFFQTNWGTVLPSRFKAGTIDERFPMGYFSNWLVIWPSAYRLEVLRNSVNYELLDANFQKESN
jgi:hypothetical protein